MNTRPTPVLDDDQILEYAQAFSVRHGAEYRFQEDNLLEMIRTILEESAVPPLDT